MPPNGVIKISFIFPPHKYVINTWPSSWTTTNTVIIKNEKKEAVKIEASATK